MLQTVVCPVPGDARMAPKWFVNSSGQVEGPFTAEELRERIADGSLRPTDSVSTDGKNWATASSVSELAFPTAPPLKPTVIKPAGGPLVAPKPARPLVDTVVSGAINLSSVLPDGAGDVVPVVTIPGYQILDTLGTGACGVVYKARQEKLNRVVALKTVLMPDRASRDLIERFKQEAVSLARLQHPNIVAVYDSGFCEKPSGQAFFAMELLEGEDLGARVERTGPLDERTAWLVARQTAAALAHAAKLGVVHRDVKPANLFLVPAPTGFPLPPDVPMVKITDFGLALTRGAGDQRQTAAGVMVGTPVYMAPEQFVGSNVDARADIYSLGATVYHMLTGHPPFDGRSVYEVMQKKTRAAPRLQPPVAAETADLVAAMMSASADDRPADYADLLARIDALPCLDGGFSVGGMIGVSGRVPAASAPQLDLAPPPAPAKPQVARRKWVYTIAGVALLGAAVGIAALAGAFNRTPKSDPPRTDRPVTYTAGAAEALFTGDIVRWPGRGVTLEKDAENKPVLEIPTAARALKDRPNFRVVLAIDRHKATTAEVVVATSDTARWLVRLDAKEVAFGKQPKGGAFEPAAAPIPDPPPKDGQPPYLELQYECAGGTLSATFDRQPLGKVPVEGAKTNELRITATGGAVRIESAEYVELVEAK